MCRLFGMTAGTARVGATFWLLDAPDSLEVQSHRNIDGNGIGFYDSGGAPVLDKQPEPAFRDEEFTHEAKDVRSTTFVAHVRLATTGPRTVTNTHPFAMRGRIMAHNGGFGELGRLEQQLGSYGSLVLGDTDSERFFALITKHVDENGGDVGAGITAAARWIGENLPVTSLNCIIASQHELWALRYPGEHALHIIDRPAPAGPADEAAALGLHIRSRMSSVHSPELWRCGSVVIASEQMDGESGWRMLGPGELVHVNRDLSIDSAVVIEEPPRRLVRLGASNPNVDT